MPSPPEEARQWHGRLPDARASDPLSLAPASLGRTWLKRAEEEYARRKRGVRKCLKKYGEAWEARQRGEEMGEEVDLGPQERPALNRSGHQDFDLSVVQ